MTAEIAVLNKEAVALAADSTVTIVGKKAYHTVNKLFSFSQTQPVGVMVYGSGDICGIPWETLIKLYRESLGSTEFDFLDQYKKDFFKFLTTINEYDASEVEEMLLDYTEDYLDILIDQIDSKVENIIEKHGKISGTKIKSVLRSTVDKQVSKLDKETRLPIFTEATTKKIKQKYYDAVVDCILLKLENHKISKVYLNKVISNCFQVFFTRFNEVSGLVFSGFGKKEIFPKLICCHIETIVEKKVKYKQNVTEIKNEQGKDSVIVPFAQTEVVATFMQGISNKMLQDCLNKTFYSFELLQKKIYENLLDKGISSDIASSGIYDVNIEDAIDSLAYSLKESQHKHHVKPVIQAVRFLPKNEMAEVAEALVSITSFRQKVSLDQESVGGAVDVAIISKSDGFIWVKRKHYFDPTLNQLI